MVAIAGLAHLRRALTAIEAQTEGGSCEVIAAADPQLGLLDGIRTEFPSVLLLTERGCNNPVALTALALQRARGERIILTEDSCVAEPGWFANLIDTDPSGRGAVGGAVEATPGVSASMWAFAYVDFFRYMQPSKEGESPSLSVCNVSYLAADLRAVEDQWRDGFNETRVHEALAGRFGPLWLNPRAAVRVEREVVFRDAIYERYAFGRLFGATRIARARMAERVGYTVASPALPFLLMGRMTAKAIRDRHLFARFVRAFPAVLSMVAAWSWGEFLGYATKALPRRITTAPEVSAKQTSGNSA